MGDFALRHNTATKTGLGLDRYELGSGSNNIAALQQCRKALSNANRPTVVVLSDSPQASADPAFGHVNFALSSIDARVYTIARRDENSPGFMNVGALEKVLALSCPLVRSGEPSVICSLPSSVCTSGQGLNESLQLMSVSGHLLPLKSCDVTAA